MTSQVDDKAQALVSQVGVEAETPALPLSAGLKPRHITMISIAGVIGAGLFIGSATAIKLAGPAVLVAYAMAGLLVVLVMRMLGEMATAQPDTGSFSTYADRALGRWAGFSIGWLYWWFWVIVIPVEATAGAAIMHGWAGSVPQWAFALAITALLMGTNLFSVANYGEFEFWFARVKVIAHRRIHRCGSPGHLRASPGLARFRSEPADCQRRLHAQRVRCGRSGHAHHDVHVHGHRDRYHRSG
jgi:GABA permease